MMKSILRLIAFTMALAFVSVHAKLGDKKIDSKADLDRRLDGFFTKRPTAVPTTVPPTDSPTISPTDSPTTSPTASPTESPTTSPTDSPTVSPTVATPSPTSSPTEPTTPAPTACKESYLTSENLNIALVVDLSYSTYTKEFSAEVDVGDVNNDGKGNTILDAQNVAIEDLLINIADSEFLNNGNCEIELISFHTDATDHGVWAPLNAAGTAPNQELVDYIKNSLWAPTSIDDIIATNNGYTNFDAALDQAVEYFQNTATPDRKNLMVFLSDGEPNVRGDGDEEAYCNDTTEFWNCEEGVNCGELDCSDLNLEAGESHDFCLADDPNCVMDNAYQDCVRGPNLCLNANATTQYDSEISALEALEVERLAIGVGDESNVAEGSALWMIDNNPAKDLGVLPVQALSLEELSDALSNLCILTTDPPTSSPSASPSLSPTNTPTASPSGAPTGSPTVSPTASPTTSPTPEPTGSPTASPTPEPTASPTTSPTGSPTTPAPTYLLPDCYDGPKMIQKDSSSVEMCTYVEDMVQVNTMNTESVTLAINNVWVDGAVPSNMTIFVHDNGVDSVLQLKTNDSFQCLENEGFSVDIAAENNEFEVQCYQASEDDSGAWLAAIDVVITDDIICGSNSVPHPCDPDAEILESCSWRIVVPCSTEAVCTAEPTLNPTMAPTDTPTSAPTTTGCRKSIEPEVINGVCMDGVDAIDMIALPDGAITVTREDIDSVGFSVTHVWDDALSVAVQTETGTGATCDLNGLLPEETFSYDATCVEGTTEATVLVYYSDVNGMDCDACSPGEMSEQSAKFCAYNVRIHCESMRVECTEEPTGSPTTSPTSSPTASPTSSPTASPTTSPTVAPTNKPTSNPITRLGEDDDDDFFFPPVGPEVCPDDILLVNHIGITEYPHEAVQIVSQDSDTVTVKLNQAYSESSIDNLYYQYYQDVFNNKCFEEQNFGSEESVEITIQCTTHTQMALLELWVADDISKGVLSDGDNAVIPNCCHPTVPEDTPITKYILQIKCETSCPEVTA